MAFVGRANEFSELDQELTRARSGRGSLLTLRGRRQVGKSTLVQEWLDQRRVPHVFFTASGKSRGEELATFVQDIARSSVPITGIPAGIAFTTWEAALELVAARATTTKPVAVVMDELPYLVGSDDTVEKALQKVWDRVLSKAPALLFLVGSDVSMMEALASYGRPLYQRATRELVIEPLSPSATAALLGSGARDAFEAQIVTGGFPGIMRDWRRGMDRRQFISAQLQRSSSDLIVTGERVMNAEFPADVQARLVLEAIGLGERTFSGIRQRLSISEVQLARALKTLSRQKRVVRLLQPYSTRAADEPRYVVADLYLRFWLRFIGESMEAVSRGQGALVAARIEQEWSHYAGRTVEPLVREAMLRLAMRDPQRFFGASHLGSWWNRTNTVEVDLVGGIGPGPAKRISFVGSIKWRSGAFGKSDLADLATQRQTVPGADATTPLVAVATSGFAATTDLKLDPDDLIQAWNEAQPRKSRG